MTRAAGSVTVEVTADGAGLVSHAGTALIRETAATVGLTRALSGGSSRSSNASAAMARVR